uniref:Uncharacterized protein n=1 Tax=Arundo donax TaxID=35708 RepID=A0A0A9EGF6_ARUDO
MPSKANCAIVAAVEHGHHKCRCVNIRIGDSSRSLLGFNQRLNMSNFCGGKHAGED